MLRKKRTFTFSISMIAHHIPFIVFAAIHLIGILVGSLSVGRISFVDEFCTLQTENMILVRQTQSLISVFLSSATFFFPLFVSVFLLGASVIGCLTSPISVFLLGIYYGMISGTFYVQFGLDGIMYCALLLIPSMLAASFGLLILAKEAFSFSCTLAGICLKNGKPINIYSSFREYLIKGSLGFFALPVAILFDVFMSKMFIDYFTF